MCQVGREEWGINMVEPVKLTVLELAPWRRLVLRQRRLKLVVMSLLSTNTTPSPCFTVFGVTISL
jgi:hypothetical protein